VVSDARSRASMWRGERIEAATPTVQSAFLKNVGMS
jgi:hypothetical protein